MAKHLGTITVTFTRWQLARIGFIHMRDEHTNIVDSTIVAVRCFFAGPKTVRIETEANNG
jgi:hypothetical protein